MIRICSDIIERAAYEPLIGLASNYRYPRSLIVSPIKFGNDVKKNTSCNIFHNFLCTN